MKSGAAPVAMVFLAAACGAALAQSSDVAAERARLGNERIQAEAELRASEEREQQERAQAEAASPAARPPAAEAPAAPPRPAAKDDDRTRQGLQQLRELGGLKDAGYVTDEEFQRIKQRILDTHF